MTTWSASAGTSAGTPLPPTSAPVLMALAPNGWAGPWMNRQQLLSRLGVDFPILYSTGVPQRGRRKSPAGAGIRGALVRQDNVFLDYLPSWLVRPGRPAWLRDAADALAVQRWRRIARALGGGPLVAYVFHPKFWPLVTRLQPDLVVYHAYDLYHLQGKVQNSFDAEERALVRRADLVVGSSRPISDHLRSLGASDVAVIENAADYDLFSSIPLQGAPDPPDVAALPHPRVGYTGALNRKVDFALVARLATRLPHVQFVLVGQPGRVDPPGEVALQHLRTCANVHFLGFKSPTDLPAYMSAMDVNVMWYRLGDDVWTAGIYPLKLHEYLAVGRPVVSTDLPVVRAFDDVIRIAANPEDWEHGIAEALAGRATGSPEQRRERARQNDWNARAAQLKALVEAMLTRSAPPRA